MKKEMNCGGWQENLKKTIGRRGDKCFIIQQNKTEMSKIRRLESQNVPKNINIPIAKREKEMYNASKEIPLNEKKGIKKKKGDISS